MHVSCSPQKLGDRHLHPATLIRRFQRSVQNLRFANCVVKVRPDLLTLVNGSLEVRHRMYKGVFIPNDVTRRPPVSHVGMQFLSG